MPTITSGAGMEILVRKELLCYIENTHGRGGGGMKAKSWMIWVVGGMAWLILPGIPELAQGGGASHFQSYAKPLPLPDFSLEDLQGKMVQIKDYRGKVILFNFWATW
jgi:hypothetical protein